MENKLLVVGTMAYDAIETPFDKVDKILGGCATYIALAASQLNTKVGVISIVGDDFEQAHLDLLRNRDVDLTGVEMIPGEKTFFWSGRYHNDLNTRTTLATELNVLAQFNPKVPAQWKDSDIVLLGNLHPSNQTSVLDQMNTIPKLVVMDTMNYWMDNSRTELDALIPRVDVICINDEEARQLTEQSSLVKAAKQIQKMGPRYVIIKKGEHGALLFHKDQVFCAPALPLEEIFDPTGAGDSFVGGFVAYLAQLGDISFDAMKSAIIYASAMASFTVEKFGPQNLVSLTQERIHHRLQAFDQLTRFEISLSEKNDK
ncbi:MAG: PfkB family carbohydrate kinase [Flavobacteriaceae bacterium]